MKEQNSMMEYLRTRVTTLEMQNTAYRCVLETLVDMELIDSDDFTEVVIEVLEKLPPVASHHV